MWRGKIYNRGTLIPWGMLCRGGTMTIWRTIIIKGTVIIEGDHFVEGDYYRSSIQFSHSVVSDSLRPHEPQHTRPPCPSPTPGAYSNIASVMPSNYLILCHTLLLLPSIFPSIRVFSNESFLHIRWPKYWSFSLASVLPMNILD